MVNIQPECLLTGKIWHDAEDCGNMPQGKHRLWKEKDSFTDWLLQSGHSYPPELLWVGYLAPHCSITWEKAETHQLSEVTATNNGKPSMSMYGELDPDFFGILVPNIGILVIQEHNELLDDCHKTKWPGIIGLNLTKVSYKVFERKYGSKVFEIFDCMTGVSPLLFSQICVFHHNKAGGIQSGSTSLNIIGQEQQSKRSNSFAPIKKGF